VGNPWFITSEVKINLDYSTNWIIKLDQTGFRACVDCFWTCVCAHSRTHPLTNYSFFEHTGDPLACVPSAARGTTQDTTSCSGRTDRRLRPRQDRCSRHSAGTVSICDTACCRWLPAKRTNSKPPHQLRLQLSRTVSSSGSSAPSITRCLGVSASLKAQGPCLACSIKPMIMGSACTRAREHGFLTEDKKPTTTRGTGSELTD
jgi:hypothetical protein